MEIRTQRFLLREFAEEDAPGFLAYHADPQYAQFCAPEEAGPEPARALLHLFGQWAAARPWRNDQLAIAHLQHPKQVLGCGGLRGAGYTPGIAELGLELAPWCWGRYAYAIEVAGALLHFGFGELGLQEVRGISSSANARVARLARRYGFVAVGTHPGPAWLRAQGWHHIEWQLTRERWEGLATSSNGRVA
jgi:[ribosomal protein S5]-alanine N-acetyltransferase